MTDFGCDIQDEKDEREPKGLEPVTPAWALREDARARQEAIEASADGWHLFHSKITAPALAALLRQPDLEFNPIKTPPQSDPCLSLFEDGAERFDRLLTAQAISDLYRIISDESTDIAGQRLFGLQGLAEFLQDRSGVGDLARKLSSNAARPVRAILFDKSPQTNWALGWHQDRVLAVRERREVESFGPWSRKDGALHVAPPFEILTRMLTVRIHIDPATQDNAPLLVAPGSHRLGRIAETDIASIVRRCGQAACLAQAGDVWVYSTPILHASERSADPKRRRVLQIDYADFDLPGGLEWLGV
ncbi:hypothetical protein LTR94_026209 [Friedmanniomyces endolithicus]|nr:hypothetical protein LTR94_026209 [Friedmanniomyces endolithicus]